MLVLFICTANRIRSPIAAAVFSGLLRENSMDQDWHAASAGTWTKPGLPVLPSREWAQSKLGLDLTEHRSQVVSQALLAQADLALVMESNHREALLAEFGEFSHKIRLLSELDGGLIYDIPDPVGEPEAVYLETVSEIVSLVRDHFLEICNLALASKKGET